MTSCRHPSTASCRKLELCKPKLLIVLEPFCWLCVRIFRCVKISIIDFKTQKLRVQCVVVLKERISSMLRRRTLSYCRSCRFLIPFGCSKSCKEDKHMMNSIRLLHQPIGAIKFCFIIQIYARFRMWLSKLDFLLPLKLFLASSKLHKFKLGPVTQQKLTRNRNRYFDVLWELNRELLSLTQRRFYCWFLKKISTFIFIQKNFASREISTFFTVKNWFWLIFRTQTSRCFQKNFKLNTELMILSGDCFYTNFFLFL